MNKKDDIIMDALDIMARILVVICIIMVVIGMIISPIMRIIFGIFFGIIGASFLIAWTKNLRK